MAVGAAALAWAPILASPIGRAAATASPDQWLGFAGSIIGAGIALAAALIAVRPVKRQLDELVRQNDHMSLERLVSRAVKLNDELILLYRVTSSVELVNIVLPDLNTDAAVKTQEFSALETACDRLQNSVEELQKARGFVWGTGKLQQDRDHFIDTCLNASSAAMKYETKIRFQLRMAHIIAKAELAEWEKWSARVKAVASSQHTALLFEIARTRQRVSAIEAKI